jgi:DNA-binding CsgD family transcriptional regulator
MRLSRHPWRFPQGWTMLLGRRGERQALQSLLAGARDGRSGALVVHGQAGIGKTALLEHAIEAASGLSVRRAVGVESEMELAFAALHQLCAPMLDRLDGLPGPQRDALAITFGLSDGPAPDQFLVGLASLSLLSAEGRPLLCVVDDAQWLDRPSAHCLAFVARRLAAESVVILFAAREPGEELRGLPELALEGLPTGDAQELLASVVRGPLDDRVREQIVAETRGNPLALLELPRGLTPAELAGGFGLPGAVELSGQIEESFLQRFDALPNDTQRLLLVAAAEPIGDPTLLWRAAKRLGIAGPVLEPAEAAGLLEVGTRVSFRHPLVRSALYRAASPDERREVHRALAEATDPALDPDRRAWHLAEATVGPDEGVAAELERCAGRAQARGGLAAAAAFLERAVAPTLDPAVRAERALVAAQAQQIAGAPDAALGLLAVAQTGPLDEHGQARADLLRGQIAFASHRGSDAPRLLMNAARRLETLDVALARETYLDALFAAQFAGRLAPDCGLHDVAQAALGAPPPSGPPRPSDLLLAGLATQFIEGHAAAAPILKEALRAFSSESVSTEEELRWLFLACRTAVDLWDHAAWSALAGRGVQLARDHGALSVLHLALSQRIAAWSFAGEVAAASALIEEVEAVSAIIGSRLPPYGLAVPAAWRGDESEGSDVIAVITSEALDWGESLGVAIAEWATAVINNSLGRYERALVAAEKASEHPEGLGVTGWSLAELILAAARSGNSRRAATALERLSEITRASGTDWALGIEARSRALLSDGDGAETLYQEAIARLERTGVRVELGRAHLQYGEWLRRERRRLDAREHLRIAHEMLTAMGVAGFAARAAGELLATGEHARKRTVETSDDLTAQELQIARLAVEGLTNPEIGARLFISPRTVEYHLHKVFMKLGISSRNQLGRALDRDSDLAVVR